MPKTLKDKSREVYKTYIMDCLAWNEDPQLYIQFLRYLQRQPNNFENILKLSITFMKRHADKLEELTDEELSAIHMEVREYFNRPKEPLKPFRKPMPKAASKKLQENSSKG